MRYYGFGNYYLSSIQQGIQNAHVISTISVKYEADSVEHKTYVEWAKNHVTTVLCNGGNSKSILELYNLFQEAEKQGMELPYAKFHEDDQSLNGALTAVGIILPRHYYEFDPERFSYVSKEEYDEFIRCRDFEEFCDMSNNWFFFKDWELELIYAIKGFGLAK